MVAEEDTSLIEKPENSLILEKIAECMNHYKSEISIGN